MTVNYTFASDEERERYELDRLGAHGDTLADHETRIDTLESGGGGGMAETLWATATASAVFGPAGGTGVSSETLTWDSGSVFSVGDDPPEIDPFDDTFLLTNTTGYHLLRVTGTVTSDDPADFGSGNGYELEVTVNGGALGVGSVQLPLTSSLTADEARSYHVIPLHLADDATASVRLGLNYLEPVDGNAEVLVEIGLSRIGASVDDISVGTLV